MKSVSKSGSQNAAATSDEELIRGCLNGDQKAWSDLLDKYKGLIYSVPVRKGLPPDGAADVFQEVCMTLLSELPNLREHRALAAWLIRTAVHKCMHWERSRRRYVGPDGLDDATGWEDPQDATGQLATELCREQLLRETVAEMPGRCADLIHMLFFANPVVSYQEAASRLGLATGSIGFIRMRCLSRLRERLAKKGFHDF